MPSLAVAVRRMLAAEVSVTSKLGTSATYATWIFRDKPYVSMEGTGSTCLVVAERGGWTAPNATNTMRFPTLQLEIYSDPDRGTDKNPTVTYSGAEDKARAVFLAADAFLHYVNRNDALYWGAANSEPALRVLGSNRLNEPEFSEVPDGDGLIRLMVRYGVVLG